MENVQIIINNIINGNISERQLQKYLDSDLVLVKVNAILAVLRKKNYTHDVVNKLNKISKNILHEPKVMGQWTTGHYAIAVLYLLNTDETRRMYDNNVCKLDENTKGSIENLIKQIMLSYLEK